MISGERFSFSEIPIASGAPGLVPLLPLTLTHRGRTIDVSGLLDTGAAVNVLPHGIGIELGAVWEPHGTAIRLTGNLARFHARPLIVTAVVARFAPVRLAFAWTEARDIPLILGQVNFFLEFDACFYRSKEAFEIQPRLA
jgi:hypothetical protein